MYDEYGPKCNPVDAQSGALMAMEYAAKEGSTCRAQLERKKQNLERQLAEVEEALKALNDNPEIERVLTLVGRTVRF